MFIFKKKYFIATIVLFIIEVLIALFVNDRFVRPYVGDFLVVILIYCFLKSFLKISPLQAGIYVLLFSYAVEIGQYFQLVKLLGLSHSKVARTVIGVGFDWGDILAYTLGILAVLGIENLFTKKHN